MISILVDNESYSIFDFSFLYTDKSLEQLDPLYKIFKKKDFVYLSWLSFEDKLNQLKIIEKSSTECLSVFF